MLQEIMKAGALGTELVLSGKLPSDRAKTWRFAQGLLKKTGDPSKVVDRAQSQATTILGVVGIKVSILHPDAHIHDKIVVDDALRNKIKGIAQGLVEKERLGHEKLEHERLEHEKSSSTKKTAKSGAKK